MNQIINELCENETFIEMLKDAIRGEMQGKPGRAIDYDEGQVTGGVGYYEIISNLNLKNIICEDLGCSLELGFTGDATIHYKKDSSTVEDTDSEKTLQGLGSAVVLITIPRKVKATENIDDIIKDLEIKVIKAFGYTEEEANFESDGQLQELAEELIEEAERDNEKYRVRRAELESLSVDILVDSIISLEDKVIELENRIVQLKKQVSDKDTSS